MTFFSRNSDFFQNGKFVFKVKFISRYFYIFLRIATLFYFEFTLLNSDFITHNCENITFIIFFLWQILNAIDIVSVNSQLDF